MDRDSRAQVREGVAKCRHSATARAHLLDAMDHATKALAADAQNARANLWYAMMLEATARFDGTKAEILAASEIQAHLQRAAALDATDPWARHYLGHWSYEVATISWVTRRLATTLIATPPNATVDEAIASFEAAEAVAPGFSARNTLALGKACIQLKQSERAREWLERAAAVPPPPDPAALHLGSVADPASAEEVKARDAARTLLQGL
jgi:tetratricopeptide (TPR) repeat protein